MIISLYSINQLTFLMQELHVFVKVGTKFLNFIRISAMLMRVKEFMTDVSSSDVPFRVVIDVTSSK